MKKETLYRVDVFPDRNRMKGVEKMPEVAVGLVGLLVVWIIGILYLLVKVRAFDSNLNELMMEAEKNLEGESEGNRKKDKEEFDCLKERVLSSYKKNKKERLRQLLWGLVLLGITVGYFAFCVTCISLGRAYSLLTILPTPLLISALFGCYVYLLGSEKCCVLKSTSASDVNVWLGVILPSISSGGTLKIVLGSMSPYPFSKEWFCRLLTWLQTAKEVSVKIISGEPEFEKMDDNLLAQWVKCWDSPTGRILQGSIRLVKKRPELQYVVTDELVRIEKDHLSWVTRKKAGPSGLITNHIHLGNSFMVRVFKGKFEKLWESATPATERMSSSKLMRSQN